MYPFSNSPCLSVESDIMQSYHPIYYVFKWCLVGVYSYCAMLKPRVQLKSENVIGISDSRFEMLTLQKFMKIYFF
jgi:hypothetical protein